MVCSAEPPLQLHYNELLRVIAEIGRDVKPAYTCSKIATDKLRKSKRSNYSYNNSGLMSLLLL